MPLDEGDLVNNTWRYVVYINVEIQYVVLQPISRDTDNNAAMWGWRWRL